MGENGEFDENFSFGDLKKSKKSSIEETTPIGETTPAPKQKAPKTPAKTPAKIPAKKPAKRTRAKKTLSDKQFEEIKDSLLEFLQTKLTPKEIENVSKTNLLRFILGLLGSNTSMNIDEMFKEIPKRLKALKEKQK